MTTKPDGRIGRFLIVTAVGGAAAIPLSFIKIPAIVSSVSLDSVPGFFFAAYLNPVVGAMVGFTGHIASAATGGFVLGWLHFLVAVQVGAWCAAYGAIARGINRHWGLWPASIVAAALTGVVGPFMLVAMGLIPYDMARTLCPILSVAALINAGLASIGIAGFARKKGKGGGA